jgi:hypothetical protein
MLAVSCVKDLIKSRYEHSELAFPKQNISSENNLTVALGNSSIKVNILLVNLF